MTQLMLVGGNYRQWLLEHIQSRKERVPSYSLRSFAGRLGISAASLSQIISGKRPLTRKMASQIAERLCLSPEERQQLIKSALQARFEAAAEGLDEISMEKPGSVEELKIDTFRMISDWYHYAILNLTEVRGARTDPEWFARRLGISVLEAHQALLRLKRLELIEFEGRRIKRTNKSLKAPLGVPDPAIRRYHYQNLRKAEESLDRDGVDLRDFGAITMAINPENLPKAKQVIQRFRRQLATLLLKGNKERVYTFVTQLFPVDRRPN